MVSNPKKQVLIFIDWYLPGYKAGGPIQSCANIVSHLKPFFNFSIVTRNADFGDASPYSTIKSNEWITVEEGVRVYYISPDKLSPTTIKKLLKEECDVLYLNSLFSVYFTLLPLWFRNKNSKTIVAPRGMFGKGALAIKPFKKKMFLTLSKLLGLYNNVCWHASTVMETEEIKSVFGPEANVYEALNLPPVKTLNFVTRPKQENDLKLFFLSRISPKKNLMAVFDFFKAVNLKYSISFDIIGPIEEKDYWEQCLAKIEMLKQTNQNIKISVIGAVEHANLKSILSKYHCLILPTFNENFGHVILDSLAAGCPVILSDQTPWRNLVDKKIGWDISLSKPKEFTNAIESIASMNENAFNELSLNAFNEAVKFYNNKDLIDQNIKLFE